MPLPLLLIVAGLGLVGGYGVKKGFDAKRDFDLVSYAVHVNDRE